MAYGLQFRLAFFMPSDPGNADDCERSARVQRRIEAGDPIGDILNDLSAEGKLEGLEYKPPKFTQQKLANDPPRRRRKRKGTDSGAGADAAPAAPATQETAEDEDIPMDDEPEDQTQDTAPADWPEGDDHTVQPTGA